MFYKILLIFITILFAQANVFAQSGIRYSDFAKKLETYFHPDLITDITNEVGKTDFTVWGWDVGDFSDDGNNDVAFCVRRQGRKDKSMDVYVFVDIDGYLVKTGQFQYDFFEIPLEIGVAFRYGILYITQKFKLYNWKIESFKFVNGSLINYDEYYTSRKGKLTNESNRNYYNLRNSEKYLLTSNGKTEYWADYLSIPSYSRNRLIYQGITLESLVNSVDFVPEGAYWWSGDNDLSFTVSSAYDSEFLYFTVLVTDDTVVKPYSALTKGESIELWLDVNDYNSSNSRFVDNKDENNIIYKKNATKNLYKFDISVGDFVNKEPEMSISSDNELSSAQKVMAMNLNVVADLTERGYYVIFKIPFALLGCTAPPISDDIIEWGCTVKVIDIDNEFRAERRTVLQNSLFEEGNPSSFGSLVFVPDGKWYGKTYNIYKDKIVKSLEEFGY